MPEYLAPGVFVEEIPARLKAIEGVSTSTAGFVGPAERGPVPGFPLPFAAVAGFEAPRDAAPVFVTSFSEFVRQFGAPLDPTDPDGHGFLGRAVQGFFENGGRRCYVSRVVHFDPADAGAATNATRTTIQLLQGVVLRLAADGALNDTEIQLNSLRGCSTIAGSEELAVFQRADLTPVDDGGGADLVLALSDFDAATGIATLAAPLPVALRAADVFLRPVAAGALGAIGPRFHARSPGSWSGRLRVAVTPADRAAVAVAAAVPDTATELQVQSSASFYRGAIVEIDHGAEHTYHELAEILPGNRLRFAAAVGTAVPATGSARVVEIDVTVSDESSAAPAVETYKALTWNGNPAEDVRRRHYASVINARSRLVYVQPPWAGLTGAEAADVAAQPTTATGFAAGPVAADLGRDALGDTVDDDYVGVDLGPGQRTGIQALADLDEVRIIACPGRTSDIVQNALIGQCERLRYRFAVLDGEAAPGGSTVTDVLAHRNLYDTSFAAYYVPWVEVKERGRKIALPPSGAVAGVYARVDVERGVHKAPANEVVRGVTGLEYGITTGEQEVLNPRGVNAIRRFEGRGIRVWGARTLSSDPEFRYVNVRRFLIFLEASLDRGTQWVVFEPNAPETWARVSNSVGAFLHTQWRSGALFGRKPEDAFFVRCDETTMSADDVQNGRLICHIGVAIVRPAEFVIFRIEQITGFAEA